MAVVIILKSYYFRIIIKNLTKGNILSTFALKHYGKFTNHNLEKLCPRFLPQTLCPQLHLCYMQYLPYFARSIWPTHFTRGGRKNASQSNSLTKSHGSSPKNF